MTDTLPFGAGLEEEAAATKFAAEPGTPELRTTSFSPTSPLGVPGTAVFSGYPESGEVDAELQGQQRYLTYSNILANVSIVGAGVRYFLNLVAKPTWTFEPPEEFENEPEAKRYAEAVTKATKEADTPWHRIVRRAAMYRFFGFSIQEWTAKFMEDGKTIGFADIEPRPQHTIERWDVDLYGRVQGVVQRSPYTGRDIYLPRRKLLYLVDDSISDSPEGLGLFRHIAKPAQRLARYETLEGIGFDTDLRGIPVGRAPVSDLDERVRNGEISEEDKIAILAPLKDFLTKRVRNKTLALLLDSMAYETKDEASRPSGIRQWDVDLLKSDSTTQAEILRSIERINREIARILGVEQLLLGDNGVGSFAMAKEKAHNFALIIDSTMVELSEAFDADFVIPMFLMNGWDLAKRPKAVTNKLQYRNIEEITGAMEQLARAGAPLDPEDPAINQVRDILGLKRAIPLSERDPDLQLNNSTPADEPTEEPSDDETQDDDES